jgi:hypothetical protein
VASIARKHGIVAIHVAVNTCGLCACFILTPDHAAIAKVSPAVVPATKTTRPTIEAVLAIVAIIETIMTFVVTHHRAVRTCLLVALATAFNCFPGRKLVARFTPESTIQTFGTVDAVRVIGDYHATSWRRVSCVGFETLERSAPFATLELFTLLFAHRSSTFPVTATKVIAQLKVLGDCVVVFDELTNGFSIEKRTNMVTKDVVILQIQNGRDHTSVGTVAAQQRQRHQRCCWRAFVFILVLFSAHGHDYL